MAAAGKAVDENLMSWVDPFDMPVELEEHSTSLSEHVEQYGGGPEIDDALQRLGVVSVKDLQFITDQDLIGHGIPAVAARRFLQNNRPGDALVPAAPATLKPPPSLAKDFGLYDAEHTMKLLAKKGSLSARRSEGQILASSFLGGAFLSWGPALMVTVAGGCSPALVNAPGAQQLLAGMVFPVGLTMTLLNGAELLTGNFLTMALPAFTHPGVSKAKVAADIMRVWGLSCTGNLVGSLFMAYTIWGLSVIPNPSPAATWLFALTVKKCSLTPLVAFGKGAAANWLVNIAIFQASSAHTTAGKIASLWLPIMTFVALGLEHSVANMFLLPYGMLMGADVTVGSIVGNIVPVAMGNALGAIIAVGGVQRYAILTNKVYNKEV